MPVGARLRGFPVIGLTYNDIVTLPAEEDLLTKFPDLQVWDVLPLSQYPIFFQIVDVERNENFDCESVANYKKATLDNMQYIKSNIEFII